MLTAFKLSQLLLGVEVMLTLMDQFCDLYVVHEGLFLWFTQSCPADLILLGK